MTPEQACKLREPFPDAMIGQRDGLDFVGHAAVTDRLLQVDPEWTWEPLGIDDHGRPLIVWRSKVNKQGDMTGVKFATMWIRITICGVTRPAVGGVDVYYFTDDVEKLLISDAIKNGAMRAGVALDLWAKEDLHAEEPISADQVRQVADLFDQIPGEEVKIAAKKAWAKTLGGPLQQVPASRFEEVYASAMDAVEGVVAA